MPYMVDITFDPTSINQTELDITSWPDVWSKSPLAQVLLFSPTCVSANSSFAELVSSSLLSSDQTIIPLFDHRLGIVEWCPLVIYYHFRTSISVLNGFVFYLCIFLSVIQMLTSRLHTCVVVKSIESKTIWTSLQLSFYCMLFVFFSQIMSRWETALEKETNLQMIRKSAGDPLPSLGWPLTHISPNLPLLWTTPHWSIHGPGSHWQMVHHLGLLVFKVDWSLIPSVLLVFSSTGVFSQSQAEAPWTTHSPKSRPYSFFKCLSTGVILAAFWK